MIKLARWAKHPNQTREKFWVSFFKTDIELTSFEIEDSQLEIQWSEIQKNKFDAISLDSEVGSFLLTHMTRLPLRAFDWGCIDTLLPDKNQWWPDCRMRNALLELIVERAPDLNVNSVAYLTGQGGAARMALSVISQLGFTRVYFVSAEPDIQDLLDTWQHSHFGLDLKIIQPSALTLQPAHGGLLINTIPLGRPHDIHADLMYLNFVDRNSLVVDLDHEVLDHPLIREAQESELRTLRGFDIHGKADWGLLTKLGLKGDFSNYMNSWVNFSKNQTSV